MRASAIWREARRNVATGTSRAVLFGTILLLVVIPLQLAETSTVSSLIAEAIDYQVSGASVSILTAEGSVDGRACEALNEVAGVRAAGAIRASEEILVATAMPSSPVPTWNVTSSFADVVGAHHQAGVAGILLGSEAAELLGLSAGALMAANGTQVPIAGVYNSPSDGRRAGYAYAALIIETPERLYDECWVDAWPALSSAAELLLTTVAPTSDASKISPAVGQLNSTLGVRFDPFTAFSHRITLFAAPAMAFLALMVGFASVRSRRVQLASALHAGVRPHALVMMTLIESALWAIPAALCAAAVSFVMAATVSSPDRSALLATTLIHGSLVLLGVTAGVALGAATIRERHLFAYFKDR